MPHDTELLTRYLLPVSFFFFWIVCGTYVRSASPSYKFFCLFFTRLLLTSVSFFFVLFYLFSLSLPVAPAGTSGKLLGRRNRHGNSAVVSVH